MRWRKCQPSPKSGKQAMKELILFLKSHIPGAAVSLHPCPWGLECPSPSVSIPPRSVGEAANAEMQAQCWVRVLGEGCSPSSLCCRQRLSQLGKQRQICIISGGSAASAKPSGSPAPAHTPPKIRSWRQGTEQALTAHGCLQ